MADAPSEGVTRDTFFGKRLHVEQPADGHRFGTDAVLLVAAVARDFEGLVYDMGAGVGAVGLGIATVCPAARTVLVDSDPATVAFAERNIATNDLGERAQIVRCDILSPGERRAQLTQKADLVITNPPFYRADRVRASPNAARRAAHVLDPRVQLRNWLVACLDVLGAKGTLIVLHKPDAVPEALETFKGQLGALTLVAVHPRAGEPAHRILLRGRKGSRAPFRIAPRVVLHEDGTGFSFEAAALHAGTAALAW